jgi:epoxyqueuosine reductase
VWCQQGRLREDSGLSVSPPEARRIRDLALEAGFEQAGFARGGAGLAGAGLDSSVLVCCLSCNRHEPDDLSTPDDPHGLIAPFARRNYYKTAVRMLSRLAAGLEDDLGIPRKAIRLFSNSRLPEKPLCVSAGLAWPAKNGLCIAPGLGSLFVIAGMVIPRALDNEAALPDPVASRCGSCRRCMDACPTGAIVGPGLVERARCLQHLAARPEVLPPEVMAKWGRRLYGCQDCQSVCPQNRGLAEGSHSALGDIGPSVSLRWFLSQDGARRKALFQGTTMGMSWISKEALVRNALVAAGNSGNARLSDSVSPFVTGGSAAVSTAAAWALERMSGKGTPGG